MKFKLAAVLGIALLAVVAIAGYFAGIDPTTIINSMAAVGGTVAFGMILDSRSEFCDATALSTAATGLALVGNVIDLTLARNVGGGKRLWLVISVDTAVTSAGAATLGFVLASDAQAAIAVDGSATEHFRTQLIGKATYVAGYGLCLPLPMENPPYERYLGILQNVGVAALTAGKINAYLTTSPKSWKALPDAI